MPNKIDVRKTTLSKADFNLAVDRSFQTFTQPQPPQIEDQVDELFRLYEELYFEIPVEGRFKSHRYLVERSLELVELEADQTAIQPLLDEIAQLREQLLQANTQILDIQNSQASR